MDLDKMLEQAVAQYLSAHAPQLPEGDVVKKADVDAAFAAFKTEIATLVNETVAKAMPIDRQGVGRQGTVVNEPTLESDPCAALAKKAQDIRTGTAQDYTTDEKQLAASLFVEFVKQGMKE